MYGLVVLHTDVILGTLAHQEATTDCADLHHPVFLFFTGVDIEVLTGDGLNNKTIGVIRVILQSSFYQHSPVLLNDIRHSNLALRLLLRFRLVILQLITHQHEGTFLPVTDEMTLLGEITHLNDALTLVVERTQLVNDRAKTLALACRNLHLEPVVSQHLLGIITVGRVHNLHSKLLLNRTSR